ncbi:MAG: GNAT family N-acetyltransferase, partial [Nostoc sp.]
NSLNYPIMYGSFEVGKSGRIEATTSDGRYTDCFINFEVSGVGRVRIQDTVVASNYRQKGVGTKLLEALESNLPDGTVLYFTENQAPDFWKKMGFQIITNNGVTEYFKIVSHPANTK